MQYGRSVVAAEVPQDCDEARVAHGGNVNLLTARAKASRVVTADKNGAAGWPEGGWVWLAAVLSVVLAMTARESRYLSNDTFYDLYAGRYIFRHGLPRVNVLTVTSHGAPWVDQQWLAHVLFYGAWEAGGYAALAVLSTALVTAGFAVLGVLMLRSGVPPVRMFAWIIVAFLASIGDTGPRAECFAFLFFALTMSLVVTDSRAERMRWRTWLAVPTLVIWANLHGSVLLGAALVGLYAGYRAVRALIRSDRGMASAYLLLAGAALVSVVCTPYGLGVLRYYHETIGNPVLKHNVTEWMPPSLGNPSCWIFFGLVVVSCTAIGVAWRRGTRPDPVLAGMALALLVLALTGVRFQAWFAFTGSLAAAEALARSSRRPVPALRRAFQIAVAGALGTAALASLLVLAVQPAGRFAARVPVQAIDVAARIAARHPTSRILGDDITSSPMLWLHPATVGRVGYDARFEQYTNSQLSAYINFVDVRGPGWLRAADGYDIIVASPAFHPRLTSALTVLPGWRVIYHDHGGIVAVRKQAVPELEDPGQ